MRASPPGQGERIRRWSVDPAVSATRGRVGILREPLEVFGPIQVICGIRHLHELDDVHVAVNQLPRTAVFLHALQFRQKFSWEYDWRT